MAVKRLLAVVAALALIAGAIVVRRFIDDGGELSLGGTQSIIYCDSVIADACRAAFTSADLVIEPPGDTLDRFLDNSDDGAVVWVAADMWFDILASEKERAATPDDISATAEPLAHSPLVLATPEGACEEGTTWKCVAAIDGQLGTGGDLNSSVGLATEVQLVVAALGRTTFASNDPDFKAWRSDVAVEVRASSSESALLGTYLNSPGVVDAMAITQAATNALASDSGRETGAIVPPDAGPDIEIGAVALNGARLPGALDEVARQLLERGWADGAAPPADRPSGGAIQALRS